MEKDADEVVGTKAKRTVERKMTLDRIQCVYGISVDDSLFDFNQRSILLIFIHNSNSLFLAFAHAVFFLLRSPFDSRRSEGCVAPFFFSLWKSISICRRDNKIYHELQTDQLNGRPRMDSYVDFPTKFAEKK